ncbi:MAG: hypothetical protein QE265_06360 [Rhodoferax sp.]|nr:hypothetical protein [Rhodoferax sp.]
MNNTMRAAIVAIFSIFLSACGGGDEEDSGANSNVVLPSSLVGTSITYTVTDSGTAGIPVGYKIKWTFSAGGMVKGVNPVTGKVVTPNSYTYQRSGTKGYVDVRYVQGTLTAYEIYTMSGDAQNSGTYTYEGDTGTGRKTASGTWLRN